MILFVRTVYFEVKLDVTYNNCLGNLTAESFESKADAKHISSHSLKLRLEPGESFTLI